MYVCVTGVRNINVRKILFTYEMNDPYARSVYAMYLGCCQQFCKTDRFLKTLLARKHSAVIVKTLFEAIYSKMDQVEFVEGSL